MLEVPFITLLVIVFLIAILTITFCCCFAKLVFDCLRECCNTRRRNEEKHVEVRKEKETEQHCETRLSIETETPHTTCNIRITNPYVEDGKLYGQSYEKIMISLQKSRKTFTDEHFPPDKYSLSYTGVLADRPSQRQKINIKKVRWVRARELFPNAKLVVNGASRSDVNQGKNKNFLAETLKVKSLPC